MLAKYYWRARTQMQHIVFIVGSYWPYPSAVGNCCFNVAEEIAKSNKVTVICLKSKINQPETECYQGQTIIRLSHKWWDIRLNLGQKIKDKTGITNKWYKFLLNIVRAKEFLQIIFSRVSINRELVNTYIKALDNIEKPIDVIVPFCAPIESIIAGIELKDKYKEIKLIPFIFDQFAESHTLHRLAILKIIKYNSHLDVEKTILNRSDVVMAVHSRRKHFQKYFSNIGKNIKFVEHPLLKPIYLENRSEQTDDYQADYILTFTGNFLSGYVMPDYLFEILLLAKTKINIVLNLYAGGNCNGTIQKYSRLIPDVIINHGYVDRKTVLKSIANSDVLVNVGETRGIQISSKIFEYMSAGKPIVHFYTADDDVTKEILKDYPLCLCLKQNKALLEENTDKFIHFCEENKDKTLNYDEVEKIYYYATPKYVADQIMKEITAL